MTIRRDIDAGVMRELEKQQSEEALLVFLSIYHPELNKPERFVSDPEDFIVDGNLYRGYDFQINLLSDNDQPPKASLSILNVDDRIGRAILSSTQPINIDIDIIALSEFDLNTYPREEKSTPSVRVYRAKYLRLVDVEGNSLQIRGTLRSWDYTQETWPALRATEDRFPGLFWS